MNKFCLFVVACVVSIFAINASEPEMTALTSATSTTSEAAASKGRFEVVVQYKWTDTNANRDKNLVPQYFLAQGTQPTNKQSKVRFALHVTKTQTVAEILHYLSVFLGVNIDELKVRLGNSRRDRAQPISLGDFQKHKIVKVRHVAPLAKLDDEEGPGSD